MQTQKKKKKKERKKKKKKKEDVTKNNNQPVVVVMMNELWWVLYEYVSPDLDMNLNIQDICCIFTSIVHCSRID